MKVADLVVGIAAERKRMLDPESERHARIGIMPARDQHRRMDEDQYIQQRAQLKAP